MDVFQTQHYPSSSTAMFGILSRSRILIQLFRPFVTGSDKSGWYHAACNSAPPPPTLLLLRKSPLSEARTVFAPALCRRFLTYGGEQWRHCACVQVPAVVGMLYIVGTAAMNTWAVDVRVQKHYRINDSVELRPGHRNGTERNGTEPCRNSGIVGILCFQKRVVYFIKNKNLYTIF